MIEKAIDEGLTILKLSPHVTDKLQSLDVACFGPPKRAWGKTLNAWINQWGPNEPIKKAAFVTQLCNIWHQGLSPNNIKAGFKATGVYLVDSTKFPKDHLHKRLVKRYDLWVLLDKPNNLMDEMAHSITTPLKVCSLPFKEKSSDANNQNWKTRHPLAHLKTVALQYPDLQLVQLELMTYLRHLMAKNVIVQLANS